MGRKKIDGTDSMDTMIRISKLQVISSEIISILEREGSKGNSTIFRPNLVSINIKVGDLRVVTRKPIEVG